MKRTDNTSRNFFSDEVENTDSSSESDSYSVSSDVLENHKPIDSVSSSKVPSSCEDELSINGDEVYDQYNIEYVDCNKRYSVPVPGDVYAKQINHIDLNQFGTGELLEFYNIYDTDPLGIDNSTATATKTVVLQHDGGHIINNVTREKQATNGDILQRSICNAFDITADLVAVNNEYYSNVCGQRCSSQDSSNSFDHSHAVFSSKSDIDALQQELDVYMDRFTNNNNNNHPVATENDNLVKNDYSLTLQQTDLSSQLLVSQTTSSSVNQSSPPLYDFTPLDKRQPLLVQRVQVSSSPATLPPFSTTAAGISSSNCEVPVTADGAVISTTGHFTTTIFDSTDNEFQSLFPNPRCTPSAALSNNVCIKYVADNVADSKNALLPVNENNVHRQPPVAGRQCVANVQPIHVTISYPTLTTNADNGSLSVSSTMDCVSKRKSHVSKL